MTNSILKKLAEGDMRMKGRSEEVVRQVLDHPRLFNDLFQGLTDTNPGVRMRSADALEKISSQKPELLRPHTRELITIAEKADQQEVQWHVAQMLSYVPLTGEEAETVVKTLQNYITRSQSNIVKVMALQTLVNIAGTHSTYKLRVHHFVEQALETGTPSIVARAKKLIRQLDNSL